MTSPTPLPENPQTQPPEGASIQHAPGPATHPGKPAKKNGVFSGLPETIRLFVQMWFLALGLEVIHQILNIVMGMMDTAALQAAVRESLSASDREQVSASLINSAAIAGVLLMGLIGIAMMGLLLWMVFLVKNRSKKAGLGRRLLQVFGFYFGFRIMIVFMLTPGGTDIPVAMYAVDGSLQILAGVAAVIALILSFRAETLKWTREIPDDSAGPGARTAERSSRTDTARGKNQQDRLEEEPHRKVQEK
ncbi:hypothetical protein [Corynebacterium sp. A21]|uniref:hypothetical protein n=1 Tax=Corynebacterium sp. A21 TaxID=3457318 RepID=UPI003FD54B89